MNKNVIMFIEKVGTIYKGHIFIDNDRVLVTTDTVKELFKATMVWELNAVYGIEKCNITWLSANQKRGV